MPRPLLRVILRRRAQTAMVRFIASALSQHQSLGGTLLSIGGIPRAHHFALTRPDIEDLTEWTLSVRVQRALTATVPIIEYLLHRTRSSP